MIKRIRTGLRASLFTAVLFSVLLASAVSAFAAKGDRQYNCFFESTDAEGNADVPENEGTDGTFQVIPGGMPFGVKLFSGGPVADDYAEIDEGKEKKCPARDAGIEKGDVITDVNGKAVASAEDVVRAIGTSPGDAEIGILRNGKTITVTVTPSVCKDGVKRIGLLIKDCTAGIGTVTFIIPKTGEFMGLGHGICEPDTGKLIPLIRGVVTEVDVSGAEKGESGDPGELKGSFKDKKVGVIKKNTDSGVVGYFSGLKHDRQNLIYVGEKNDLEIGDAYILNTVGPGEVKKYSVTIERIPETKNEKNIELRITDPELIKDTGGIVQGMSGSPIIQNGKLVGAVTHVMINDPVRGYGIAIEEMLKEVGV